MSRGSSRGGGTRGSDVTDGTFLTGLILEAKPAPPKPSTPIKRQQQISSPSSRGNSRKGRRSGEVKNEQKQSKPRRPQSGKLRYHPHVEAIFDPERDAKCVLPYFVQRDYEMQSATSKRKRKMLRKNMKVDLAVDKFCCLFNMTSSGRSPAAPYGVEKDEYVRVHTVVAKLLIPALSVEQARSIAEEDWLLDTKGKQEVIAPDALRDAVFHLTDIWCLGISAEEYCSFLKALYERTTSVLEKGVDSLGTGVSSANTAAFLPQAVHALPVIDSPPRPDINLPEPEVEDNPLLHAHPPK